MLRLNGGGRVTLQLYTPGLLCNDVTADRTSRTHVQMNYSVLSAVHPSEKTSLTDTFTVTP